MKIKTIVDEDFVNYKLPSLYIAMNLCNFKCCRDSGLPLTVCQNSSWAKMPTIEVDMDSLIKRYLDNPITKAIVFSGLEPMDQHEEVLEFIRLLRDRYNCNDPVVIYTGYTEAELVDKLDAYKDFGHIIFKFGRYVPDQAKHFDQVLGIYLASYNQYGKEI